MTNRNLLVHWVRFFSLSFLFSLPWNDFAQSASFLCDFSQLIRKSLVSWWTRALLIRWTSRLASRTIRNERFKCSWRQRRWENGKRDGKTFSFYMRRRRKKQIFIVSLNTLSKFVTSRSAERKRWKKSGFDFLSRRPCLFRNILSSHLARFASLIIEQIEQFCRGTSTGREKKGEKSLAWKKNERFWYL